MTDYVNYWDSMSPYLDSIENLFGINIRNLDPLYRFMQSPVLVVGAGQGLLVEVLRQKSFVAEGVDLSSQMVEFAEKRRNIKLFHANANKMPFQDKQFASSIVASGVIDFLNDSDQIRMIINEVKRVTSQQGRIFVTFIGFTPADENLLRYAGVITPNDNLRMGAVIRTTLAGKNPAMVLGKELHRNRLGIMLRIIRSAMSLPKARLMAVLKAVKDVRKKIESGELPDPKTFLDSVPEQVPVRNKDQIHKLFKDLNISLKNTFTFDNCTIVQLSE